MGISWIANRSQVCLSGGGEFSVLHWGDKWFAAVTCVIRWGRLDYSMYLAPAESSCMEGLDCFKNFVRRGLSVWLMVLDCWFKTSAKQLAALIVLLAANPHQCRMLTERHLSALHAHQGFLKKTRSPLHANHAGRELWPTATEVKRVCPVV